MKAAAEKLKKLGLKATPQRQAILKLLQGNKAHPSAETIYAEISRTFPSISFATVYNTLSKLVEAGELQELDTDPSKKRFDPSVTPHSHFYCQVCGKVYDIIDDTLLPLNIKEVNGHQVEAIQFNYKGVCKDCSKNR